MGRAQAIALDYIYLISLKDLVADPRIVVAWTVKICMTQ